MVVPELSSYVRGNEIVVRAEFRFPDEDGTLTDPTTVTFTTLLQERDADPTPYVYLTDDEVTREAAGIFELAIIPGEGVWHVHVQGTGACHAAGEISFEIRHSRVLA